MKFSHPLIFFLDDDLMVSAKNLSDKFLDYNIKNASQILVCSLLYMVGIRNKKICKYYFCKERKTDSLMKFFPNWPLDEAPKFVKYNSEESKWCRKCKNHYDIILKYLGFMMEEFSRRFGKEHELYELYDFLRMAPYEISIRTGIKVIYIQNLKIILPWKNLPLKFRKKNIIEGYRIYYKSLIFDPYFEYESSNTDIPPWLLKGESYD